MIVHIFYSSASAIAFKEQFFKGKVHADIFYNTHVCKIKRLPVKYSHVTRIYYSRRNYCFFQSSASAFKEQLFKGKVHADIF